jgi:hypothetical protein
VKKQRAMRRAPSEQCDYVFEGSAADCYAVFRKNNKVKNQIYRGVAQLGEEVRRVLRTIQAKL